MIRLFSGRRNKPRTTNLFVSYKVRFVIKCSECTKPRPVFSHSVLTDRALVPIIGEVSEYVYTCGAPILPPQSKFYDTVAVSPDLKCGTPIQFPYYSSKYGRSDICCYCAAENCVFDNIRDLRKKARCKTVLPMCEECKDKGLEEIRYGTVTKNK